MFSVWTADNTKINTSIYMAIKTRNKVNYSLYGIQYDDSAVRRVWTFWFSLELVASVPQAVLAYICQAKPLPVTHREREGPIGVCIGLIPKKKIKTSFLDALRWQNAENLKQIFPEKEYRGLSPNFHIHVSVSKLYIPTTGLPFKLEEICGPIPGNI